MSRGKFKPKASCSMMTNSKGALFEGGLIWPINDSIFLKKLESFKRPRKFLCCLMLGFWRLVLWLHFKRIHSFDFLYPDGIRCLTYISKNLSTLWATS